MGEKMERLLIEGKTFDEERSLYHISGDVKNCIFAGPKDGESVLKECRDVTVEHCAFSLRYPLWHTERFVLKNSTLDLLTRAPIWYAKDGVIDGCTVEAVKCLRECDNIAVNNSRILSPEFGWRCRMVNIVNSYAEGEYMLFESRDVTIDDLSMKGKYSFQYIENMTIKNSRFDTKDAFWHAQNVTVTDTVLKGEYLGWYSENLTLIRCHIVGTQPLCYCKNLTLIDCTTENCDLAFEYSEVTATVIGDIISVKNPASGKIVADHIDEIIWENSVMDSTCQVISKT